MTKAHENYRELIWTLAKTDFKLRYHGSVLGYFWALLKPFLTFLILNFVFSSVFNFKNTGDQFYSLQLLISIMLFNFFSEGTTAGMMSLMSKSSLVTKIYVPRWTIILASTINASFIFLMNLIVVAAFCLYYKFIPSIEAVGMFGIFVFLTYFLIVIFAFLAAPLFLKFRDLGQIWDVAISAMFYATPIVYPLSILPAWSHSVALLNPMAFIIHFMKTSLVQNNFPSLGQFGLFVFCIFLVGLISMKIYQTLEKRVAETI